MKFATPFVAAAIAAQAYGAIDSCPMGEYATYMPAFMQGFQTDVTSTSTDCYTDTVALTRKMDLLFNSFTSFDTTDWAAPFYMLSDASVASSDFFVACSTTNFAKQMSVRFSSLAGLFDFVSTIGVSFLKQYRDPGNSDLYNAFMNVNDQTTCAATALAAG